MPKVKSEVLEQVKIEKPKVAKNVRVRQAPSTLAPAISGNKKRAWLKNLAWFLGLCVLFFVLLNWGFVVARIKFIISKPEPAKVLVPKATTPAVNEGSWPKNTLAIPSLGVSAPVVYVSGVGEEVFQAALQNGVVHYPGSSLPGEVGNVYIFGHSSDYAWSSGNYKSVFALLPKIKKGAEIKLTNDKGFLYTYKVTEQFVVGPNDVQVLSQETGGKHILTLQTSYPVGTALRRYVVRAELRQSD